MCITKRLNGFIRIQAAFLLCGMLMMLIPVRVYAENEISPWAAPLVDKAIALELVPESLRSNYQDPITRAEFCQLIYALIREKDGPIPSDIEKPYSDTDDVYVSYAAQCNIVTGTGNGKFLPLTYLTRQQAAVMLTNTAKYLKRNISQDMSFNFNTPMKDCKNYASWAVDSIAWVRRAGIMNGTSNDLFSPNGLYTREQSIITILRLYDVVICQKDYRNFKNYVVSLVPVKIENDVFYMEIPENTPYRTDIEKRVLDYCNWVQDAAAMSFTPSGSEQKLCVCNYGGTPYGSVNEINLKNSDYMLDTSGAEYVYLHELSHTLEDRQIQIKCLPFQEAFAILNSAKIAKNKKLDYLYWYLMSSNYAHVNPVHERNIINNFEHFYRTSDYGEDNYTFGFRFGVYLETKYGEDIFSKIIKAYQSEAYLMQNTRDNFVDFIKTQTSNEVFTEFVSWYWKNKSIFKMTECPILQDKQHIIMPIINKNYRDFVGFPVVTPVDKVVSFDFSDSHAYAQYHGYSVKGIRCCISTNGPVTIKAYDRSGNLLKTDVLKADEDGVFFYKDATMLVITGNNCTLTFSGDFEGCYTR